MKNKTHIEGNRNSYWLGKSPYGCKYRVEFNPKRTKGVKLGLIARIKLLFGADLIIAHH